MKIVDRADCRAEWDAFVDAHPFAWFWHRSTWLDYILAYGNGEDHSFALFDGGRLTAICPAIAEVVHGESVYAMGGDPGAAALALNNDISTDVILAAEMRTRALVRAVARRRLSRLSPLAPALRERPNSFTLPSLEGETDITWMSRIVDLRLPLELLWQNVRESYRSLIHRVERDYEIVVDDAGALGEAFARVHMASVGQHLPRPARTYELNTDWIQQGHALLVGAKERGGSASVLPSPGAGEGSTPSASTTFDAFIYVVVYKGAAYYSSAPSLVPSVIHGLQWATMMKLKARGISHYELGWQGHAQDQKGKNIEFFKAGFGGYDAPTFAVERVYD